jgi:hypothetical protein
LQEDLTSWKTKRDGGPGLLEEGDDRDLAHQ